VAKVRATCETCGDVEMTTADVNVQVGLDTGACSYSFRCPECRLMVTKPANERIVGVLMSAGVRTVPWRLPAELQERKSGPPLSPDDLLAFHMALEADPYLSELAGSR